MKYTNPNSKSTKNINFEKSTLTHVGTVMNEALDGVNIVLNDFNKDLADYNKINFLVKDRAKPGIQIISATLMDEWREVANC